jgi:hypothetical protein
LTAQDAAVSAEITRRDVPLGPGYANCSLAQIVNVLNLGCQYPDVISLPWLLLLRIFGRVGPLSLLSCAFAEE